VTVLAGVSKAMVFRWMRAGHLKRADTHGIRLTRCWQSLVDTRWEGPSDLPGSVVRLVYAHTVAPRYDRRSMRWTLLQRSTTRI
jgi:hypothetical protein